MKRFFFFLTITLLGACSAWQPYKDYSLDELKNIEKNPTAYLGKIVSFTGDVKGLTEGTQTLRMVLQTDVPFYYYATGKGNSLSYELILVTFPKTSPAMTHIQKSNTVKVLARVNTYEKRKNALGMPIGVLHLNAFALTDRNQKVDFFHTTSPEKELYTSWKSGRLFYQETPEQIVALHPSLPAPVAPPAQATPAATPAQTPREIVYDEEEEFVLTP